MPHANQPAKFKLTYFNGRGRGELSRLILAQAGIDYEGERALDAWLEWLEEHSTTYQAHLKLLEKEQEKQEK